MDPKKVVADPNWLPVWKGAWMGMAKTDPKAKWLYQVRLYAKTDGIYTKSAGFCTENDGFYTKNDGTYTRAGRSVAGMTQEERAG